MRKIVFISVMTFGLMSFTNVESLSEVVKSENKEAGFITCCTATVTYNGEPVTTFTECVSGMGPATTVLACALAESRAKTFIKAQI